MAEIIGANWLGIILVCVAVIWGLREAPNIKAWFDSKKAGANGATGVDPIGDLKLLLASTEKTVLASLPVRQGVVIVLMQLEKVADALPNASEATQAHAEIKSLITRFGDPTPAGA